MVFEGVAGCGCERKSTTNTSTMVPTFVPKLITNRCENGARKSDAKRIETSSKIDPKRHPKSRKVWQTYI